MARQLRICETHWSGFVLRRHSQKRMTANPRRRISLLTSLSRFRLRWIFADQYCLLVRGMWPHLGHPCQKQPSTKMASFAFVNAKSGVPIKCAGLTRQPEIPLRMRAARSLRSVERLLALLTARIFRLRTSGGRLNEGSVTATAGSPNRRHYSNQPNH